MEFVGGMDLGQWLSAAPLPPLPPLLQVMDQLLDALNSFQIALTWPEALQRIQAVLKLGLQQDNDFEKRWPEVLGTLPKT